MMMLLLLVSIADITFGRLFTQSFAQGDDDVISSAPTIKQYTIGVYLINVGKIDMQIGSYDLDFYYWLASDDKEVDFVQNPPKVDFMNALNARIEPSRIEPNYYEARVKGTFLKNMDFRNYPFDKQEVTV
ncbi:MAG: hypothetical protein QXX64_04775, partial [Nitrososphaera sp.]